MPTIQFPSDWERRQDHAVEVTKAWIRKGQETDGDAEVQSSSEEDKKEEAVSTDSYYCQFAAALKDCPALTTGFWAVSQKAQSTVKDGSNNIHDNICFCPCSVDMGRWRQCCLAEAAKDGSIDLFEDILKCSKAHFSPKELLQHCEEVAEDCNDSESRVFHAIMHKYLECLFGEQEGLAHLFEATLVGDGDVEEAAAREDMEIMNEIRQDIQRLEEVRVVACSFHFVRT